MSIETGKIYNEDCLETMERMGDNSVDLIATDSPYGISYETNYRKNEDHEFTSQIENDENLDWLTDFVSESYRILKDGSAIYMFCSMDKVDIFKQKIERKFSIKNIIIWVKNNWTAGDLEAQYGKQYEMIIYANKGRSKINGKRLSDVWHIDKVAGKQQEHQNQKPVELMERIIKKSSDENDIVYDPFMGSGTTAVASHNLNRQWIGNELDDDYCEMARNRIENIKSQRKMF